MGLSPLSSFVATISTLSAALRRAVARRLDRTRTRKRSIILLVAALAVIPVWQNQFTTKDILLHATYSNTAPTGLHAEQKFFFFLYHLGLYPLMTTTHISADTKEEALRLLDRGDSLRVDYNATFRAGDRGRTYLYYVDAWLHGEHIAPSIMWANAVGFWFALCALFAAFWWVRMPGFGALVVAFLGSDPFQLYATYRQDNVIGWPVTAALVFMAMHLPLMVPKPRLTRFTWVVPIAAAVFLATMKTVRAEVSLMAASALMAYLTLGGAPWRRRLLMAGAFIVTLSIGGRLYSKFFVAKFKQAHAVMVAHGGTPYTGPLPIYHEVWHPIYCGLGDFDTKYGYKWDDRVAYAYALPILKAKYGIEYKWNGNTWLFEDYYDEEHKYPKFVGDETDSKYTEIIREKILTDIKNDPKWFLEILGKRAWRILTETPPLNFQFGKEVLSTKSDVVGILCVPLVFVLALARRWKELKILLFTVPLSAPAFIVFSGKGMTMLATWHYFGAVIMLGLALEGLRAWLKRPSRDAT
jgi:hypothetical protein